jgi:hypothetical protein
LRGKLELAARKRTKRKPKWNLSQEILLRLRCSLDKEHEAGRSLGMRRLCFLISDMAKRELYTDHPGQESWHRDPYTFRAFKIAVAELLDGLEPPGEMRLPPVLAAVMEALPSFLRFEKPEQFGGFAAYKELVRLKLHAPLRTPLTERDKEMLRWDWDNLSPDYALADLSEVEQEYRVWPSVRHAFGINEPGEP